MRPTTSGCLRLRFYDDFDSTGVLVAQAESNGFAGTGSAYFAIEDLKSFARALREYPLQSDSKGLSISGGFGQTDDGLEAADERLGLKVYPVDARGHIGVQVRMAADPTEGEYPEARLVARLEIKTVYESISQFGKALLELVEGKVDEAVLKGELS